MRKPGFTCLGLLFCLLVLAPAWLTANVRAPYYIDTNFSGTIRLDSPDSPVWLSGEEMTVRFPGLDLEKFSLSSPLQIDVVYRITNSLTRNITIPVRFLGLKLTQPLITLNDLKLPVTTSSGTGEALASLKKEFLAKLIRHRLRLQKPFYQDFFINLSPNPGFGNADKPGATPEEYLDSIDLSQIDINKVLVDRFRQQARDEFSTFDFNLSLTPGLNTLHIQYKQGLFFNEYSSNYGKIRLDEAVLGFDYLLYPAFSWKLSADFSYRLTVEVPDFTWRTFFIIPQAAHPAFFCNLDLKASFDAKKRLNIYTGSFNKFPEDILTFVVSKAALE